MPESAACVELCDCPRDHYRAMDGRCTEPSLRSEEPEALARYTQCGCRIADSPDVYAEPDAEFLAVPGSALSAEVYVATLHPDRQRDLREREERRGAADRAARRNAPGVCAMKSHCSRSAIRQPCGTTVVVSRSTSQRGACDPDCGGSPSC